MDSIETLQTDETILTPQEKEIVETLFQVSPQKNITTDFSIVIGSVIATFLGSSIVKKIIFPNNEILFLITIFVIFLILFSITKKM